MDEKAESGNLRIGPKHGHAGFELYFAATESGVGLGTEKILKNVRAFKAYVSGNGNLFPALAIQEKLAFSVDLSLLATDEAFNERWPDFSHELRLNTEECLSCLGLAVHQTLADQHQLTALPIIRARIKNFHPVIRMKLLKVDSYGTLVSVRGSVVRAGCKKLQCVLLTFKCQTCGGSQVVQQVAGVYTTPAKCQTADCKRESSKFAPLRGHPYSKFVYWQNVKLQELAAHEEDENGRVARTIECELTEDLVESCSIGDTIVATGVVKVHSSSEPGVRSSKDSSLFRIYLDAVAVANETKQSPSATLTFTFKDHYDIQQIHAEPALFRLLVQSLCPSIFGHELVKAGLLLALLGGTKSVRGARRSNSHVLLVGDPGLGKSRMLQACANAAPRGIYVCGTASTSSGLTVTMTRESGGDFALEAGALVLADQGCCCIDEFDKMSSQHACLLEAMEQQKISIAKAGVLCNVPARATILAAANPSEGHYNKGKPLRDNLKISGPMLSRFDLIFVLLDKPDAHHDLVLCEHIIALRSGTKSSSSSSSSSNNPTPTYNGANLSDKLKLLQPADELKLLPMELLRKYLAYAQIYVNPRLTEAAKETLKKFHLELRRSQNDDSAPITTRQLESMKRLTQARAKLELREEASAADAADVVEIIKSSFLDASSVDNNKIRVSTTKKQTQKFLQLVSVQKARNSKNAFHVGELEEFARIAGVPEGKFRKLLDTLNMQGFLLKKPGQVYELVSNSL